MTATTASKRVTVGGFKCDGIQTATIFYPTDTSKKYPLLSFSHGWTEGGRNVAINYKDVLETVAASGYVVIAGESGLVAGCLKAEAHDQIRALDYVNETSEFAQRVDWSSKMGVYGHSMGGGASLQNAADAAVVEKYNLGAAMLLHPTPFMVATKIPSFYATGNLDTIVPAPLVLNAYNKGGPPKIFAEMSGATHFECQSFESGLPCPHGWTGFTINWMNCHIKGIQADCDTAYNVCNQSRRKMSKCIIDKGTSPVNSSVSVIV